MSEFEEKERRSGLTDTDIAETVDHLVGESEQRQRELATSGRGKPGHAGQLGKDKNDRDKATYDLSVERQALIREMADAEDVAKSDIVEAAVVTFYNAWKERKVSLNDLKEPTRSLRVMWKLKIPDDLEISD